MLHRCWAHFQLAWGRPKYPEYESVAISAQALCLRGRTLGTGPLLGQAQMSTDRKRANRALKRKVEKGIISKEDAKSQFRHGDSSSSKHAPHDAKEAVGEGKGGSSKKAQHANKEVGEGKGGSSSGQNANTEDTNDWQFKGEGKGGSLGILVGSKSTVVAVAGNNVIPPAPKANTKETVQEMFDTGYFKYPETAFWDGKNIKNVVKGTHFLWKNVPMGKNGGESTKTEVFHGECHGWENDFVIVS